MEEDDFVGSGRLRSDSQLKPHDLEEMEEVFAFA